MDSIKINKLLNKLSQILLCTIWTDKGLFDCRVWAQQGRGGATGKTTKWSSPLVPVQPDSEFGWKASNRLIMQPQAHFPLLGECCPSSASEGACWTLTSSQWQRLTVGRRIRTVDSCHIAGKGSHGTPSITGCNCGSASVCLLNNTFRSHHSHSSTDNNKTGNGLSL